MRKKRNWNKNGLMALKKEIMEIEKLEYKLADNLWEGMIGREKSIYNYSC